MRLVIKEYLLSLKEDKELDLFFIELLISMSISPVSTPQRGRQYGVDIFAVGIDPDDNVKKIFLFTIKQGNLNRGNWNTSDPTSVKPSLEEIKDVFIKNHIPTCWDNLPIKIIVATNGELEQSLQQNWAGFDKTYSNDKIQLFFWGIDEIMFKVERYLMNEFLLPKEQASLLRKALAFLDIEDYDLEHFYSLINEIACSISAAKKKENRKKIRLINLCLNIVYHWCIQNNNLKPAILASERCLLETWGQLQKNDIINEYHLKEFVKLLRIKKDIDLDYFTKVHENFYLLDGLSNVGSPNHIEYCLITYEQIGIISSIGLMYLNLSQLASIEGNTTKENLEYYNSITEKISEALAHLIAKNPSSFYPMYDEHCIELNLAMSFLFQTNRKGDIRQWINGLHNYIVGNYKMHKVYPLFHTNYETLVEIMSNEKKQEVTSSMLFVILLEWALIIEDEPLYNNIKNTLNTIFKEINLQIWFPDDKIEGSMYTGNVMSDNGATKSSIKLPETAEEYIKEIKEELEKFNEEKNISPIKFGFPILVYWSSRHYRNYLFPFFWRKFLK